VADDDVLPRFLAEVGERFAMECEVRFPEQLPRICVLASKQPHCLLDLLARWRTGELRPTSRSSPATTPTTRGVRLLRRALPPPAVEPGRKAEQEAQLAALVDGADVELVVLARYMQVLSEDLCARYPHRIINIHHSLLPAFVGAKPYHQAFERGVKVIGATAHYATAELDQGPILAQDVAKVTHRDSVDDLVARGRDLEAHVLARAGPAAPGGQGAGARPAHRRLRVAVGVIVSGSGGAGRPAAAGTAHDQDGSRRSGRRRASRGGTLEPCPAPPSPLPSWRWRCRWPAAARRRRSQPSPPRRRPLPPPSARRPPPSLHPSPPTRPPPAVEAPPAPPAVVPLWTVGATPLPLRADGFGEVQPTPEVLRDRRLPTTDLLPPPPGGVFAAPSSR
jgi:formyltetrahydrofolate deformylase